MFDRQTRTRWRTLSSCWSQKVGCQSLLLVDISQLESCVILWMLPLLYNKAWSALNKFKCSNISISCLLHIKLQTYWTSQDTLALASHTTLPLHCFISLHIQFSFIKTKYLRLRLYDYFSALTECLITAWRLLEDCLKTDERLNEDCEETVRILWGDCKTMWR